MDDQDDDEVLMRGLEIQNDDNITWCQKSKQFYLLEHMQRMCMQHMTMQHTGIAMSHIIHIVKLFTKLQAFLSIFQHGVTVVMLWEQLTPERLLLMKQWTQALGRVS